MWLIETGEVLLIKKRIGSFLLALVLVFGLCACGNQPAQTPQDDGQILQQRRQIVVDEMHNMMSFLWSTDVDITYSKENYSKGIKNDKQSQVITLQAGRIYSGLPYTHGCGSSFDFQAFATEKDEKGIYRISGMTGAALTGEDTFVPNIRARVGNDCSEAVFWAWSMVAASVDFKSTSQMTMQHGCIPVGNYSCDPVELSMTKEVTKANGKPTMYQSYAKLQPGDALVHNNLATKAGSHAMLVDKVVIATKEDGSPDYSVSYAVVTHQTSGNLVRQEHYYDEELGEEIYLCCRVEDMYLFDTLFDSGYLPVTCKELIDPSPLEEATVTDSVENPGYEDITTGIFSSAYAVSNVTITITDENDRQVQKCTTFATESELKAFSLGHFNDPEEVNAGNLDLSALKPGTYRCVHTCRLSTGDEIVVRDITFTVQ